MAEDPFAEQKAGVGTADDPDILEFDLSDVQELSFHIPEGDYAAELVEVTKETSQAGNPMYVWKYKITSEKQKGFTLWNRTAITQKAMFKVQETVDALGFPKGADGKSKFNKTQAVGRKVVLAVQDSEYQGEKRSEIARVKKHPDGPGAGGGASSDFNPDDL